MPHASWVNDEERELREVRRRIRNVLAVYPASGWDLTEAEAVLAALGGIVRGRQTVGDVINFPSA